jgi:hypothetical protein
MRKGAETLIFWGGGATESIGLRTTQKQAGAIKSLTGENANELLADRVIEVLSALSIWAAPYADLLCILGDDAEEDIYRISLDARDAMSRHWHDTSPQALDARIHELRALFDWPALKDVVRACPGFKGGDRFQLQDVFNLIDLHAHSFHGFPVQKRFLSPGRLVAARRALQMLLNTLFYIDWQTALSEKQSELDKHMGFARLLAKHHQEEGLKLAATRQHFDSRDFYLGNIAFASLNYDPVALWAQFIANRDANRSSPPCIGVPRVPLKIFHDFGIFMAVSTIDGGADKGSGRERVWYPLNEASAQRLNDRDHVSRRVRINKFLFPHGCLCWRECPSCGKLTAYMGKEWKFLSHALIPPPPLQGFMKLAGYELPSEDGEFEAWDRGEVDARACVHCGELTFSQHTQAVMQSNFKAPPPSFIEEVQRDLRVATQAANHVILMGYSLPPDDVTYRAFFAARRQKRSHDGGDGPIVRCSVVGIGYDDHWHGPDEINQMLPQMEKGVSPRTTLEAARDLFGRDNVRFFGGGIPQVFCEGDTASPRRFQQLIDWTSTA